MHFKKYIFIKNDKYHQDNVDTEMRVENYNGKT